MKKLLLSIFVLPLCAMELQRIDDGNIMKLSGTRNAQLYCDINGFQVNQDGQYKRIPSHRLTQAVRKLKDNPAAMDRFLNNNGYLKLTQNEEGEYALDADGRLNGGFLLTGVIVYNTFKYTGYAAYGVGSLGAIAAGFATGGVAGAGLAYSAALGGLPTAIPAIESGALIVGTAASWIPWLP